MAPPRAEAATTSQGGFSRQGELMGKLSDLKQRTPQRGAATIDFTASGRETEETAWLPKHLQDAGGRDLFAG